MLVPWAVLRRGNTPASTRAAAITASCAFPSSGGDGTLTGQAQVTGQTIAIGGVVNADGVMTTNGAVAGGSHFSGRFWPNDAGGTWHKVVSADGAQRLASAWGIESIAAALGCQQRGPGVLPPGGPHVQHRVRNSHSGVLGFDSITGSKACFSLRITRVIRSRRSNPQCTAASLGARSCVLPE